MFMYGLDAHSLHGVLCDADDRYVEIDIDTHSSSGMVGVAAKGLLHTTQPYQYAFYHDQRRFICGGGEAYSFTNFLQAGITRTTPPSTAPDKP